MFGMTVRHDLHCIEIRVAFAFIPLAATTMPGIFTRRETRSEPSARTDIESASDFRITWMACNVSSPMGLGEVISSSTLTEKWYKLPRSLKTLVYPTGYWKFFSLTKCLITRTSVDASSKSGMKSAGALYSLSANASSKLATSSKFTEIQNWRKA